MSKSAGREQATIAKKVMTSLEKQPGQTATQLANSLGLWTPSVASFLAKQAKAGLLERRKGGPRGGWAYYLPKPIHRRSAWERLTDDVDSV